MPICSHPLLIVERLRNIQDNCEKVVLAFCVGNRWEKVQVEREVIAKQYENYSIGKFQYRRNF